AVYGLVLPALETELLEGAEVALLELVGTGIRQATALAFWRDQVEIRRRAEIVPRDHVALGGRREVGHRARARKIGGAAAGRVDGEQRRLADVVGRDQQRLAVARHV